MRKKRVDAHPESILAALQALGAPINRLEDAARALAEKQADLDRGVQPVIVAWEGQLKANSVRVPANSKTTLVFEDGSTAAWPPRESLPHGYHKLHVQYPSWNSESLIVSAPTKANFPIAETAWGAFAPLYALHSKRGFGVGDLTDLESLIDWITKRGGRVASTLPLLSAYLEEPFEPSPYSPVSRLFWNEFYIDPTRAPEFESSPKAQRLMANMPRQSRLVDYRGAMHAKRQVLEAMAESLLNQTSGQRYEEFRRFAAGNPEASLYARFRGNTDRHKRGWHDWPQTQLDSMSGPYHLYAQWIVEEQLDGVAKRARDQGCLLYLDLPLGLHFDSYDTWRYPELFVKGMSGGAPPDPVFTTGQNWAFQPTHPQAMRADGYRYTIAALRNHLRFAKLLRIDHVMGLHRLFWIPDGMTGDRGLYVEYPAEEIYAILSLESHRAGAGIVGENLGVVPPAVNRAMARHNIRQLYVAQYETAVDSSGSVLRDPPAGSVASLNTHDMFPFQAFLDGGDIPVRMKLGHIDRKAASAERRDRLRTRKSLRRFAGKNVFQGCLEFLARSKAGIVLLNLEDLWGETKPQNIPSTTKEHPNWRRRMRYSMERLQRMPLIAAVEHRNHNVPAERS